MPLLLEYTVSLLDNEKICVDFADSKPSDYELSSLLEFFRSYKREVYIEHIRQDAIEFVVMPWQYWIEFLITLGFGDTAQAICEVLNDLELDRMPTMEEYIDQLKHAKPIKGYEPKPAVFARDTERFEELKRQELRKMVIKKYTQPKEKTPSEIAFERDALKLSQYMGQWVAYRNGEFLGADTDKDILITIMYERDVEPDLIKKIEEEVEKDDETE